MKNGGCRTVFLNRRLMNSGRGCSPRFFLMRMCLQVFLLISLSGLCLSGCSNESAEQEVHGQKEIVRQAIIPQRDIPPVNEVRAESNGQAVRADESPMPEKESPEPLTDQPGEKAIQVEKREGYYRTSKGDSLYSVAARPDIYGDPLKWVSLFRVNAGDLKGFMAAGEGFQHQILPEGIELRFMTEKDIAENASRAGENRWVVNVISTQEQGKAVMPVITLIKNGYHVYSALATVKGEKWIRVRAGFFSDRSKALSEKAKMQTMLQIDDMWIARIEDNELTQFAVY